MNFFLNIEINREKINENVLQNLIIINPCHYILYYRIFYQDLSLFVIFSN